MFSLLEGDGVIENLYHLLWTKDTIFGTEPYVMIPDTILYKYQKPYYWYFTSKKDNKLKKKSSMRLTNENISDRFTKQLSPSGIVAYYIYKKNSSLSKYETDNKKVYENPLFNYNDSDGTKDKDGSYVIEHFDLQKFNDFLSKKLAYEDGILQKFEDPKGDYNFTVRLQWSPKICILEKKTCLRRIKDNRYNIYERAVTYEGEEFQIKTEPIKGNLLPDRIEKIANSIVNHVSNITLERIKIIRMILNFKITQNDNILFLWCSSLRVENNSDKKKDVQEMIKEYDVNKIKVCAPDSVNLFKFSSTGKPIIPHKDSLCLNCDMFVESNRLFEISFGVMIESHDNRKRDIKFFKNFENVNMSKEYFDLNFYLASSGIEVVPYIENKMDCDVLDVQKQKNQRNFLIPKVINKIYPRMKYRDYQSLKNDAIFNTKTANVCEICFLNITRYCDFWKSNTENVLRILRPKEINAESKFMKTTKSDYKSQHTHNVFFTQNKGKINTHYNNNRQNVFIDPHDGSKKNNHHKKQISYNTLYPIINNKKFFSVEKENKDLDKTDLDSRRSNSIYTKFNLKK